MLTRFKTDNFKSFMDGFDYSLEATSVKELTDSLIEKEIGSKKRKILSTSVVYGPNSSGKTNFINVFSLVRRIVLRGDINNSDSKNMNPDRCSSNMELIPFFYSKEKRPTTFDISFIENNDEYRYVLSIDLNEIVKGEYINLRKVVNEELYFNNKCVFSRENDKCTIYFDVVRKYNNNDFSSLNDDDRLTDFINSNIENKRLFLTSSFKELISKEIANTVVEWFRTKLLVLNNTPNIISLPRDIDNEPSYKMWNTLVNDVSKEVGAFNTLFDYKKSNDNPIVYSTYNIDGVPISIPSQVLESKGVQRMQHLFPFFLSALQDGRTLVIDEIDASLHPMVVMNLISIFHNPDINKKGAQLIFNTHNASFLQSNLFRRDEIVFIEKDKNTFSSSLYKLSDFKTNGEVSVRKTTDYMKNYFIYRYGAIEYVDLSDVFERFLNQNNAKNEPKPEKDVDYND